MISRDQIKILSNKHQTNELNIRREYFQHLFLSYFYQQSQAGSIYFKGGTALRMVYKSPRFSEDLDFSTSFSGTEEIEEVITNTLVEVEKENVAVRIIEAKETQGGYLGTISFEDGIDLQLQISLRIRKQSGEMVIISNDFIPPYTVVTLAQSKLVEEKMAALFDRKKPRDFYDLYFMLRANLIPQGKRGLLIKAKEILRTTNINFEVELKQFLPKTHWAIIRDFKTTLEREINRFI